MAALQKLLQNQVLNQMAETPKVALPALLEGQVCRLCELPLIYMNSVVVKCDKCTEQFHLNCFDTKMLVKQLVIHKTLV